jgi:hypothetical protein
MTEKLLNRVELVNGPENYIVQALAEGNVFCQELACRVTHPRTIWTWTPIDLSEYTSRLQFGGVFTPQQVSEIYDSLLVFATDYLRSSKGEILVVLNQLARPNDPFLQKKSTFFVWENTVNFFARGGDIKSEDVDRCFREKRGYPPIAFLSHAPGIQVGNRSQLHRREVIALIEGMTHLIVGIFDGESYIVAEAT